MDQVSGRVGPTVIASEARIGAHGAEYAVARDLGTSHLFKNPIEH